MAKFTVEEMQEAINRLPEEEKGWQDVKRALRSNASERDIKKAFDRRCPEAKDPDCVAWQEFEAAQQQITSIRKDVDEYFDCEGDLFAAANMMLDSKAQAEFEEFKADSEKRIAELAKVCEENKEGWKRWRAVTRA